MQIVTNILNQLEKRIKINKITNVLVKKDVNNFKITQIMIEAS